MQTNQDTQADIEIQLTRLRNEIIILKILMDRSIQELGTNMDAMILFFLNKSNVNIFTYENSTLKQDIMYLRSELSDLRTKHINIQGDVNQLQILQNQRTMDEEKLSSALGTTAKTVGQLYDLWKKEQSTIAALETRLCKTNVHVAFTAFGRNYLSITQPQTIVCDQIGANIGYGYNGHTGIFTAPVSGTYCFMATASPDSGDVTKQSFLVIDIGGNIISFLCAIGIGRDTGHLTGHMLAGQTTMLRSTYSKVTLRIVFFAGMLIQADT